MIIEIDQNQCCIYRRVSRQSFTIEINNELKLTDNPASASDD